MSKQEPRSTRLAARVQPSLYKKLTAFSKKNKWSISTSVEEAIIRLVA